MMELSYLVVLSLLGLLVAPVLGVPLGEPLDNRFHPGLLCEGYLEAGLAHVRPVALGSDRGIRFARGPLSLFGWLYHINFVVAIFILPGGWVVDEARVYGGYVRGAPTIGT